MKKLWSSTWTGSPFGRHSVDRRNYAIDTDAQAWARQVADALPNAIHEVNTARAADRLPWTERDARMWQTVFPQMANWLPEAERDQLRLVFESLDENPAVRVIVLRAQGEHFSSGGDIKGFLEASPEHVSKLAWNIAAPARCSKPVIAANRGYCFGVGFEISLACDFRLVTETTRYALPEQKLGQIPGSGHRQRLDHDPAGARPDRLHALRGFRAVQLQGMQRDPRQNPLEQRIVRIDEHPHQRVIARSTGRQIGSIMTRWAQ